MQLARDAVNDAAADNRFPYSYVVSPGWTVREEILHADRQVVVGTQQSGAFRDDAVPVMVRVAGESHVELIFERDQAAHGIRRRRIHADAAVPVEGHEAESRIDGLVYHGQVQTIALGDRMPVVDARST